ncbi:MAG TPA: hypothetical protein VGF61_12970 [Candidatus Acidoferrum sp.]
MGHHALWVGLWVSQSTSCTSLMPTAWPAKTWLKLIFFLPRQILPQHVTTMVLSWKG